MESIYKTALSKSNLFIKKNITNIGEVMDNLLKDDSLTWDERSKIGLEKDSDEQCQILLEILIRRGGNNYNNFLDALSLSGNNHIVEEIEKAAKKIANSDRKFLSTENLFEEKKKGMDDAKLRVIELEEKLNNKKEKLSTVHDQQIRALEDLKKLKEKANNQGGEIRILEMKNQDMEREISRLKQTIDYLQKQITLKDGALKRVMEEKRKLETEHTRAIQNLERKQDQTQKTCEKLSENVVALTKAVVSLQTEIKTHHPKEQPRQYQLDISNETPRTQQPKRDKQNLVNKSLRSLPHKISTCNFGEAAAWKQKKSNR
ncbi:repetitive organellar protein-like [Mytilus californianus]|uniref:repetitive organellar protein-like n=1 Tax=Mytilus californianus TaxID=6549 RepID=UPI0022452093|nr:repetitive organellar protein-like [Mytilus californianus]